MNFPTVTSLGFLAIFNVVILNNNNNNTRSYIEKWKEEAQNGIVALASSMKYKAFIVKISLQDFFFEEINFLSIKISYNIAYV